MNRRPCPCAIRRATNDPNRHSLSETDTGCRSSFRSLWRDRREFPADGLHACLLESTLAETPATFMAGGLDAALFLSSIAGAQSNSYARDKRIGTLALRAYGERVGGRAFGKPETMPPRSASSCRSTSAPGAEHRWHRPCSLSVVTPLGRRSAGRQPLPSSFIPGGRRTVASRHAFLFHQHAARSLALRPA
jgi:hypothetical protein